MAKNLQAGLRQSMKASREAGLIGDGVFSRAPLDLRFAMQKTLDPRITFTRASSATFVDSSGVLQRAVTNLLLRSEEFDNASWTRFATTATANVIAAPNGTITADKIAEDSTNDFHGISQYTTGFASSAVLTLSIYAKAAGRTRFRLQTDASGGTGTTDFDLSAVTASAGTGVFSNGAISDVGNNWYRCSVRCTTSAAGAVGLKVILAQSSFGVAYTGDGTSGIFLWGAQLEQASTVGEYIPTTSAINSAPRFDHAITSSTTNLVLQSEDFSTAWSRPQSDTITTNTINSPTNTLTANSFVENSTASSLHTVIQDIAITANATYTVSLHVKAALRTEVQLKLVDTSDANGVYGNFNLSTGVATSALIGTGSGNIASMQALPNGWYRCILTGALGSSITTLRLRIRSLLSGSDTYTGSGQTALYFWGAQLEQSSTVGPYVPTTTAAVTSNTTDSLGLLVEEARTNSIRNNTMVGAVAGTPGTLPTNWSTFTSLTGLTRQIVGTGTENGISYLDVKLSGTPSAAGSYFLQFETSTGVAASNGQTWTSSGYFKLAGGSLTGITTRNIGASLRDSGGGELGRVVTAFTPTSSDIITQRVQATVTNNNASTAAQLNYIELVLSGAAIDITLRIGLPQLEQGAFATSVIPTTSATATRAADVASITGANFGTTRTNLLLQSENFGTTWTANGLLAFGSGSTLNALTAPDGQTTADLITENTSNSQHNVNQTSTTIGAKRFSVFAKQGPGARLLRLIDFNATDGAQGETYFNLSTGAVVSGPGTIQALPNGWYRCSIQSTTTVTSTYFISIATSALAFTYTGDGASGIYLWGAQLETGSTATAYIPTTTAAVSVFESSWYNQTEGTVFVDATAAAATGNFGIFSFNASGTSNNRIDARIPSLSLVNTGGTQVAALNNSLSQVAGQGYKTAVAYAVDNYAKSTNGSTSATDVSGALPIGINQLEIGSAEARNIPLNQAIKRLTFWPTRLSNTTLQQISQP